MEKYSGVMAIMNSFLFLKTQFGLMDNNPENLDLQKENGFNAVALS